MLDIKHILFPLDFSARCCAAAPYVQSMAARFGSKVTLISVAQPFYYSGVGDPGGAVTIDTDALLLDLKERLGSTLVKEFGHLPVERVAELGDPAQVVVDFAHNHGVDLIMMPTHGYGPFRSLLLGSVTAKVLHDAECPVWTAAHVEDPTMVGHVVPCAILCAVDGNQNNIQLLKYAAQVSRDCGATLRLVHVIPGVEAWPARQADREFEEDLRVEARKKIKAS